MLQGQHCTAIAVSEPCRRQSLRKQRDPRAHSCLRRRFLGIRYQNLSPGVTDLRTYTRKLEFLRDLWPPEHIEHLAPRAALQVEGSAFQKVARLKAEKLRTADGVKYLVESLGGQWGKLADEDRYDLFERALFSTQQKSR